MKREGKVIQWGKMGGKQGINIFALVFSLKGGIDLWACIVTLHTQQYYRNHTKPIRVFLSLHNFLTPP